MAVGSPRPEQFGPTGTSAVVIVYGCCVGSWDGFAANIIPRVGNAEMIALSGQDSIASAYNKILRSLRGRTLDALVLLHDDLEITDPDHELKILSAADRHAVSGVVGSRGDTATLAWWDLGPIGHQITDSAEVGSRQFGLANTVDGSIMILSGWAVQNLRFDERYPGFHGYDVDLCRQMTDVGVIDLATHHHTTLGWKSDDIRSSWEFADQIYRGKWGT